MTMIDRHEDASGAYNVHGNHGENDECPDGDENDGSNENEECDEHYDVLVNDTDNV